jgi:hypothetical protein
MDNTIQIIKPGEHILALGRTGSGKTYFSERFIQSSGLPYFCIDTQDSVDLPGYVLTSPNPWPGLDYYLKKYDQIRYVPKMKYREREWWNWLFEKLVFSSSKKDPHPRIIHINEIYHIGYGIFFPDWVSKGLTTARQRHISFYIEAQRPKNIPTPVISESSRIYCFKLKRKDDKKYVAENCGEDEKEMFAVLNSLELDHSFIEINDTAGTWRKMPKIKV